MKRLAIVGIGLVLILLLSALALENDHRRLRLAQSPAAEVECADASLARDAPTIERLCGPQNAYIAYAELDDQGLLWDPDYLTTLGEFLSQLRAESELVIVMLVHGWNHDVSPDDSNVACFKEIVQVINRLQTENNYGRQVVGVFVGWRGQKYSSEILNKSLTFWNRMAVADNLGGRGDLRALIRVLREQTAGPDPRNSGALVLAGHSLGGRALFGAIKDDVLSSMSAGGTTRREPADLVVLLNPAFTAIDYREIHAASVTGVDAARADQRKVVRLLVAGSRDDRVTKDIYPLGERFRRFGQGVNARQDARLFYGAVGHFEGYFSHELVLEAGGYDARERSEDVGGACPFVAERHFDVSRQAGDVQSLYDFTRVSGSAYDDGAGTTDYTVRLQRLGNTPSGPAMFVAVDGRIIPNHNNVYTPPLIDFLIRVVNYNVFCGEFCNRIEY